MNRKLCTVFLLTACVGHLAAEECGITEGGENDIAVDISSGALVIRKFAGVRPQKPIQLGSDVFNPGQMEKAAPKIQWKKENVQKNSVTLSTVLPKNISGIDLDGVEYRKTCTFDPAIPEVRVKMEFRNRTGKTRYAYWGVRNEFEIRTKAHEPIYIPTANGTFPLSSGFFLDFYSKTSPWTSTPVENWSAKLNPITAQGIVFLTDPDVLSAFYAGQGKTIGFMFDGGYLPPNATYSVTYTVRPFKQLRGVTSANREFVTNLISNGKKISISIWPYADGTLEGTVEAVDMNQKSIFSKPVRLTLKKETVVNLEFSQPPPTGHTAIRFSGKMNGKPFATEQYCENGVRMQSLPACEFVPCFTRPLPVRKFAASAAAMAKNGRKKQAVCFFGLYTDFNRFDKILNGWKIDNYSVWLPAMKDIPPASTLGEYSVMIIGNAFASSLEVCMKRIYEFVRGGGTLIITGGPSAFGTGAYEKRAILREIIPFETKPFDLRPTTSVIDHGAPITGKGINAADAPYVYWMHRNVKLKHGAQVLWSVGKEPLLVHGTCGKGQVFCFLAAPLGDPKDGKTPYWNSSEYKKAMSHIINSAITEGTK